MTQETPIILQERHPVIPVVGDDDPAEHVSGDSVRVVQLPLQRPFTVPTVLCQNLKKTKPH